jgi:cytochrome c-type biogenesis protein CcmF
MLPTIGRLALLLSLVVAVYAVVAATLGDRRRRPALVSSARNAVIAVSALLTAASAALLYALATHDFSVRYVAEQSNRDMPLYITLAAFYSSQAGSLLFWGWTLSLFATAAILAHERRHPRLFPYLVATLAGVEAFFVYLLVALSNPFERLWPAPPDGRGLNPLLYDGGMLIHPPLQLMGYMASTVPFAFVVAALVTGRLDAEWVAAVRRWMLAAWALLGSGLLLGAWWAYHVLGWGGYWGWDPVENAGLLPWLTMTAYLHSAMVQERRGMLKVWNVGLVLASFALAIFGTLIVRSGILSSVHAFAQSAIGPAFFAFLALVVVGSIGLLFYRLPQLRDEGTLDSALSRESSFLVNNLLLVGIALATFWGTIYPLVAETVQGVKVAVGPTFYRQVNGPLLFALVVLMAICALLPWRRAAPAALWRGLRWPLAIAIAVCAVSFLLGARAAGAQLGILACTLAGGAIVVEYVRGVRLRRRNAGETVPTALVRLVGRGRRRYGGYLVHASIALMGIGIVGSLWFQSGSEATVAPGEQFTAGRYTFTFQGLQETQEPGMEVVYASVDVAPAGLGGGASLALRPAKRFHRNWEEQPSSVVAIHTVWPWMDDVYLVLAGWDENGRGIFQAFVNPLVTLLWAGLFVFWGASLVLLWPEGRPAPVRAARRLAVEVAR